MYSDFSRIVDFTETARLAIAAMREEAHSLEAFAEALKIEDGWDREYIKRARKLRDVAERLEQEIQQLHGDADGGISAAAAC